MEPGHEDREYSSGLDGGLGVSSTSLNGARP